MSHETTPSHSVELTSSALGAPAPTRQSVAITGAASFLGTNLVGMLEQDDSIERIVCLDVKPPATLGEKSRAYEVDLARAGAEERLAEVNAVLDQLQPSDGYHGLS